jgi:hypothetical protein
MLPSTAALISPESFLDEAKARLAETALTLAAAGVSNESGRLAPWLTVAGAIAARAVSLWPQVLSGEASEPEWIGFGNAITALQAGRNLLWALAREETGFLAPAISRWASLHQWAYSDLNLARREFARAEPPVAIESLPAPIRFDANGLGMVTLLVRDQLVYAKGRDGYADALVLAAGTIVSS